MTIIPPISVRTQLAVRSGVDSVLTLNPFTSLKHYL